MFQDQFKGTGGDWELRGGNKIFAAGTFNSIGQADVKDFMSKLNKVEDSEMLANAKLMVASKKIAFELDNLLDALCGEQEAEDEIEKAFGKMIAHRIFMAKNALKQAL